MGETAGLRSGIRVLVTISTIAVAVMLALAVFAALRANNAAAERGERLDPAATTTALLLADFVDQESAVRGYLITEEPSFLGPYNESDRTIPQQMNRLQQLLAEFPDLIQGTAEIEAAYQAWRSDVAEPEVAAMEVGDVQIARNIEKAGGRVRFNELRGRVADLGIAIDNEQTAASGRLESAAVLLLSSLASAAFVILGVVLTVLTVLRRWLLRPIDALRRAVNAVAAGRYDTRIPEVGPEEIVELAGNIEAMRAQLVRLVRQNERSWEALAQQGPAVVALRDALTPSVLRAPGLVLRGRVDPAQGELAGDWYDSFELPDGRVGIVVGDVSGHGAVAGVFALRLKQLLDAALTRGADPGQAIEWVVDSLGETDEMFATAVVAVVDPASGEVRLANAGHPDALLLRRARRAGPAGDVGEGAPRLGEPVGPRTVVAVAGTFVAGAVVGETIEGEAVERDAAAADAVGAGLVGTDISGVDAVEGTAGAGRGARAEAVSRSGRGASGGEAREPGLASAVARAGSAGGGVGSGSGGSGSGGSGAGAGSGGGGGGGAGAGGPALPEAGPGRLQAAGRRAEVACLAATGPIMSSLVAADGAWHTDVLQLEPGDVLFVYTDGLVEARNAAHQQFGVDRLVAELLRDPRRAPAELLDDAFEVVRRHAPGRPSDDRTAIVVARTTEVSRPRP
ncbi:SpoIIE family protein phosphatase [Frankia sp. Mgl5]|uniref:SpoIIE family protein phosphatase n=1 Tax=Frankia sp. Mgl5 TaxID=2933793 RepID=UPI0027E52EAA|nr:SpoIIE family protein phosphatase [Frankia sp. Mgl5]